MENSGEENDHVAVPIIKAEEAKSCLNSKVFWLFELLWSGKILFEMLFLQLTSTFGFVSFLLIPGV